jgi:hypothetical protein
MDAAFCDAGRRRGGRLRRGGEERRGHAGVQSIGSGVVDAAPGDHFELIAHQTSGATKNLAADELTCLL